MRHCDRRCSRDVEEIGRPDDPPPARPHHPAHGKETQLTEQPSGIKEFSVLDADGNLIKFGERTGA